MFGFAPVKVGKKRAKGALGFIEYQMIYIGIIFGRQR